VARTTAALLAGVIAVPRNVDPSPFIEMAHQAVEDACGSLGYSESKMTVLETLMAAHFLTMLTKYRIFEQADVVKAAYANKVDLGYDLTPYGQNAMRLDNLGGLAAINNAAKKSGGTRPGVSWIGQPGVVEEDGE
jgi:hypothetical protein